MWDKARGPNWEWAFQLARLSAIPHALFRREWEARESTSYLDGVRVCMCVLVMPLASRAAGPWEVQQWRIRGGTLGKTRQQPRGLSVQRFPLSPGKQSTTFQCFGGATLASYVLDLVPQQVARARELRGGRCTVGCNGEEGPALAGDVWHAGGR